MIPNAGSVWRDADGRELTITSVDHEKVMVRGTIRYPASASETDYACTLATWERTWRAGPGTG